MQFFSMQAATFDRLIIAESIPSDCFVSVTVYVSTACIGIAALRGSSLVLAVGMNSAGIEEFLCGQLFGHN